MDKKLEKYWEKFPPQDYLKRMIAESNELNEFINKMLDRLEKIYAFINENPQYNALGVKQKERLSNQGHYMDRAIEYLELYKDELDKRIVMEAPSLFEIEKALKEEEQ